MASEALDPKMEAQLEETRRQVEALRAELLEDDEDGQNDDDEFVDALDAPAEQASQTKLASLMGGWSDPAEAGHGEGGADAPPTAAVGAAPASKDVSAEAAATTAVPDGEVGHGEASSADTGRDAAAAEEGVGSPRMRKATMASPRTDAVVAEPEAEPEPAAAAAPKGILAGPHSAPKVGTGEREQDLRKIQSCPPRVSTSILKTPDQSGLRRAQSAPLKFTELLQARSDNSTTEAPDSADESIKVYDGPGKQSALVDRMIVTFFEKPGLLRDANSVRDFVSADGMSDSTPALAARLGGMLDKMRGGGRVGLLPSNARLGPEHAPRLQKLSDWLNASLPDAAGTA